MRQAFNDTGWLLAEDGQLQGFALGYDFCSEHEWGVEWLKKSLGIEKKDFPLGVEDRTMTVCPSHLVFETYDWRSSDKRFKKTVPAAVLHCCRSYQYATEFKTETPPKGGAGHVKFLSMDFGVDCFKQAGTRWYKPERDDIVVKWGSTDGFAVHVRGEENVARLRALHEAFARCDIALADPAVMGFLRRSMAFVIASSIEPGLRATVRAGDEAHKRLHDAFDATGIKGKLTAAGRKWYALGPDWREDEGSELLAYLNPHEQRKYNFGWFTIPELEAWAQGTGPVITDERLEAAVKDLGVDHGIHLMKGLEEQGVKLRCHERPQWADADKTVPGLRLLIAAGCRDRMADGVYPLSHLRPIIERGRILYEQERAQQQARREAEQAAKQAAPA